MSTHDRATALADIHDRYPHRNGLGELTSGSDTLARYCLIERSTHDSGDHYLTLHLNPDEASEYWQSQEEPGFWDPIALVDLDTGRHYDCHAKVAFELTFEPAPAHA